MRVIFDDSLTFNSARSFEMSSREQMINQAEPTRKIMIGVKVNNAEWTVTDSADRAIKYPKGVFQLNGNLQQRNEVHFIYDPLHYIIALKQFTHNIGHGNTNDSSPRS